MHVHQLLLCLLAFACAQSARTAVTGPEARAQSQPSSAGVLDSVLRGNGKSRQSRCVRCYEDRYYGSSSSGDRYGSSDRYGGYASRAAEDPRSSWYYSYDRYDDRSRDRDYDRYSTRDERYMPRSYDRYEGRGGGYDDYYRRGAGAGYERGYGGYSGYSSGYDSRDRYYNDRYSDSSRDRYYDRSRAGYNSDRYDPYDRYYSRGQSGFDNSGRGYYFAGNDDDTRAPYDRERASSAANSSPCGHQVANCPYDDRGTKVSSSAIGSDGYRGGHTSVMGDMNKPSWMYLGEQDKPGTSGGSRGGVSNGSSAAAAGSGVAGAAGAGGGVGSARDREHEHSPQSSSYGGRPRPLGGSYLFDRNSNAVAESPSSAAASSNGDGGDGSVNLPAAAAQTAAQSSSQAEDKPKQQQQ
ncbi:stress protein DDR48, partial [Drosophila busckii]|uniref:stress protein DDR48 n=1 Tax=Drosophila busckii TaxID=30019 RepID=UPI0014329D56